MKAAHAMRFGATVLPGAGVRFALWAPHCAAVAVQCCDAAAPSGMHSGTHSGIHSGARAARPFALTRGDDGWHEGVWPEATPGMLYRFALDSRASVPDPASRSNPQGVHGPSEVVDARAHDWSDAHWCGMPWHHASVYELHVGSFTPQGTFDAAAARLPYLRALGVTAVELMPLAAFSGRRGWGYDGVLPFAPHAAYGTPAQLKRFVQAAHTHGLMVLLDVVYNHFGADGNYLPSYCPVFDATRATPWGAALRLDGPAGRTLRRLFIDNALYWTTEYRFDGLRLDAVHALHDEAAPRLVEQIAAALREGPGRERHVHLVLENDANCARRLARDRAGRTLCASAQWNDDFHHAAHVLATGERHGYYLDYQGQRHDGAAPDGKRCQARPAAAVPLLAQALAEGFVYQGQPSMHCGGAARGEPSAHLPSSAFVAFLQNHDQIGNRACGERLDALAPPERIEVLLACLLLAPQVPLLFMGEEFAATSPFLYFCDFDGELAAAVREGRRREFAGFARWRDAAARAHIPDPNAADTFAASKLCWDELASGRARRRLALVQQLLSLRRDRLEPHLGAQRHGGSAQCDAHTLQVDWWLGAGVCWTMRASFGVPLPDVPLQAGAQEIYRSGGPDGDALCDAVCVSLLQPR